MAVLPPTKGSRRRPSYRGNLLQDTTRGVERSRKWPEKKGSRQTKGQLDQQEWFRQVNWAFKFMAPQIQFSFRKATQGTSLYPRDLLSIIAANGLFTQVLPDNRIAYTMPFLQAVSESLDAITQVPGSSLIRGPNFWTGTMNPIPDNRLVTRVKRTSNLSPITGDLTITWQASVWDEIGMWNIATPTKLIVPANVSRMELGAAIYVTGGSGVNANLQIRKNGVAIALVGAASGWTAAMLNLSTGPIPVAENDQFELVLGMSASAGRSIQAAQTGFWAKVA